MAATAGLWCMSWPWHRDFARHTVPRAMRRIGLFGIVSLASGAALLAAMPGGGA